MLAAADGLNTEIARRLGVGRPMVTKWRNRCVRALNADIRAWINTWNQDPKPYVWIKTADHILESIATYCNRINPSRH